jgi:hypothetical protein
MEAPSARPPGLLTDGAAARHSRSAEIRGCTLPAPSAQSLQPAMDRDMLAASGEGREAPASGLSQEMAAAWIYGSCHGGGGGTGLSAPPAAPPPPLAACPPAAPVWLPHQTLQGQHGGGQQPRFSGGAAPRTPALAAQLAAATSPGQPPGGGAYEAFAGTQFMPT